MPLGPLPFNLLNNNFLSLSGYFYFSSSHIEKLSRTVTGHSLLIASGALTMLFAHFPYDTM